jgi:hypothetical protein
MDQGVHYVIGSSPKAVLAEDVRRASRDGWSLVTDPQTVLIDGNRLVYRVLPDGSQELCCVLRKGRKPTPHLFFEIERASNTWVRLSDLVTRKQIADRLQLSYASVQKWCYQFEDFPKPLISCGKRLLYDFREVKAWRQERVRKRQSLARKR